MRSLFAKIRCASDVLRNRMPAALAMLKAHDVGVAVFHKGEKHGSSVQVTFYFDDDATAASGISALRVPL